MKARKQRRLSDLRGHRRERERRRLIGEMVADIVALAEKFAPRRLLFPNGGYSVPIGDTRRGGEMILTKEQQEALTDLLKK